LHFDVARCYFHGDEYLEPIVRPRRDAQPQRLDYLNEAMALERVGDVAGAITSYRLACGKIPTT
jgi:hypothetical protein